MRTGDVFAHLFVIPLTYALPWRRLTACRGLGMSPLTEGQDKKRETAVREGEDEVLEETTHAVQCTECTGLEVTKMVLSGVTPLHGAH